MVSLRQFIVTVTLLLFSTTIKADELALKNGGFGFKGNIASLYGAPNQMALRTGKFTLPNGTKKNLVPVQNGRLSLQGIRLLDPYPLKSSILKVFGTPDNNKHVFKPRLVTFAPDSPNTPKEPDEGVALPAVEALLPPSQSFGRLNLRIVDAGFESPASLTDPDNSWGQKKKWLGFYFSYRVRVPRGFSANDMVSFNGLYGPNGNVLSNQISITSGKYMPFIGGTMVFREVDPSWKNVHAEFEVQDPASPPNASGKYVTDVALSNIPLPQKDAANPKRTTEIRPNIVYTSPRGTKYTLSKISSRGDGAYRLHWDYVPSSDASDLTVSARRFRVLNSETNMGEPDATPDWFKRGFEVMAWVAKKEDQKLDISFQLEESSRAWKIPSAFKKVSFTIPVSALTSLTSIHKQLPAFEPILVQGRNLDASWEMDEREWNRLSGVLWLRDKTSFSAPNSPPVTWQIKSVKCYRPDGMETGTAGVMGLHNQFAFHSNNERHQTNETSIPLSVQLGDNPQFDTVNIRCTVERSQELQLTHRFENIPLPAPGETKEFSPDDFSDSTLALRRIVWVNNITDLPSDKQNWGYNREHSFLLITFDRTVVLENSNALDQVQVSDDKGLYKSLYSSSRQGNPLGIPVYESLTWTLQIDAPYPGSKTLGLSFRLTERKPSGISEDFVIPNVKIPPR